MKDDLKYYERRIKVSASEKNIAKSQTKTVEQENKNLKDRISQLEKNIDALNQDLNNKKTEIEDLNELIKTYDKEFLSFVKTDIFE